jgi:DNA-binding beta-propeller fold protein YncE
VTPIDLRSGATGIPVSAGKTPRAIALTPGSAWAYATNFSEGTITPIDLTTGRRGSPIKTGSGPIAIAISSWS